LKARAENGMRVNEGHKEAAKFLKVDMKPKLLPRPHEQLCSTHSRGASPRANAKPRGVRLQAEYGDLGTNGNHSRGKCDGGDVSWRAVKHKSLRFHRIVAHEMGQEPLVPLAEPGINLSSTSKIARERRGGRNIRINEGRELRDRWGRARIGRNSNLSSGACRVSPRSGALLKNGLMMN
jgi:hypothetical protein